MLRFVFFLEFFHKSDAVHAINKIHYDYRNTNGKVLNRPGEGGIIMKSFFQLCPYSPLLYGCKNVCENEIKKSPRKKENDGGGGREQCFNVFSGIWPLLKNVIVLTTCILFCFSLFRSA